MRIVSGCEKGDDTDRESEEWAVRDLDVQGLGTSRERGPGVGVSGVSGRLLPVLVASWAFQECFVG